MNDSDSGGAAHAMSRLHEALRRIGIDSHVLLRNASPSASAVETIATRGDADEYYPVVRDAVLRQYVERNRTGISNTHFSLHIDGADISRLPLVASSEVVHLHWTASFQTPADVRALLDAKPVVWTLHDLEPLSGGCHFPAGCERYADDCAACPQLARDPFQVVPTTLRDKKTLWAATRPTFVAPSRYMAECARRSAVARDAGASIVHIPNGIDVETFCPRPTAEARRALGLPVDGLYVLCGSNYNAETRKGVDLLDRILRVAGAEMRLLTVGEPKLDPHDRDGIEVIQLGRVPVDLMPTVYAAADVFLHPALEDNFPCMLLESLSCGTPAVAFDIGGVADIIEDGVSGCVVPAGDELGMAAALSSLVGDRERLERMRERARARIETHFSDTSIARMHADLYGELLQNRAAPRAPAIPSPQTGVEKIFPRLATACLVDELAFARERQRDPAELARELADEARRVQEKEDELTAIYAVAEERRALTERLHASAESIGARAAGLQSDVEERDRLLIEFRAMMDEQRVEIELVHRVAAERRLVIEDAHRKASERIAALERDAADLARNLADQSHQVKAKEAELTAIYAVADERKALAEQLHASAARLEALAANVQSEVREREDRLAKLHVAMDEQRTEIELVHRVAAERQVLVEDLHRAATVSSEERLRQVRAKDAELSAIYGVAEEREALAEQLHASAGCMQTLAANLQHEVRERDELLSNLAATMQEQHREIELIHRVAAERAALIEQLSAQAGGLP